MDNVSVIVFCISTIQQHKESAQMQSFSAKFQVLEVLRTLKGCEMVAYMKSFSVLQLPQVWCM